MSHHGSPREPHAFSIFLLRPTQSAEPETLFALTRNAATKRLVFACRLIELSHKRDERASFDSTVCQFWAQSCRMLICASVLNRVAVIERAAPRPTSSWPPITRINYESNLLLSCRYSTLGRCRVTTCTKSRTTRCTSRRGAQGLHTTSNRGSSLPLRVLFSKLSCHKLRQVVGACPPCCRGGMQCPRSP